ncbi:glutathionylspermidine synthase family protein [bacterium]|nr:glutathionylspermidine synthase family protein [bacterium]
MRRLSILPRPNWQKKVEAKGLEIHTLDGKPYWNESACYVFTAAEIDVLEKAVADLFDMCVQAAGFVIENRMWDLFDIPPAYGDWIVSSWDADQPSLYGRFDLSWNGSGPPKMLEFNADTPTSLVEAAVIQWFWLEDRIADGLSPAGWDQFNSLHEKLIASWAEIAASERITRLHLASMTDQPEDLMTALYLLDTAKQAGLDASMIDMSMIGFNPVRKEFVDTVNDPIDMIFKLYPWEWMIREKFGRDLPSAQCLWIEPPWKMVMSNKAILPVLWEMFPNHPNLLWAGWNRPEAGSGIDAFVSKPIFGREGSNVIVETAGGSRLATQEGPYDEGPLARRIYQAFAPLPEYSGVRPVLGGWVIGGEPAGLGIREDDGPITTNFSRFVPHAIEG